MVKQKHVLWLLFLSNFPRSPKQLGQFLFCGEPETLVDGAARRWSRYPKKSDTLKNGTLTMPRLGGFAVEKKVPLNNKCRVFFHVVKSTKFAKFVDFHWWQTLETIFPFHVFWSQMMAELLGVSPRLQVRLPSLQSLEKQLEATMWNIEFNVETKTNQAGHQKWFLKSKMDEMNQVPSFVLRVFSRFFFFSGGLMLSSSHCPSTDGRTSYSFGPCVRRPVPHKVFFQSQGASLVKLQHLTSMM